MSARVFQFCIIKRATGEERKAGKKDELVVNTESVLADSEQQVVLLAGRRIPEDQLEFLDQMEIAVRPF